MRLSSSVHPGQCQQHTSTIAWNAFVDLPQDRDHSPLSASRRLRVSPVGMLCWNGLHVAHGCFAAHRLCRPCPCCLWRDPGRLGAVPPGLRPAGAPGDAHALGHRQGVLAPAAPAVGHQQGAARDQHRLAPLPHLPAPAVLHAQEEPRVRHDTAGCVPALLVRHNMCPLLSRSRSESAHL